MSGTEDPRAQSAARWQLAAAGWSRRADQIRAGTMAVSAWMIDHANLQPGERVLELAAGPGDTGFLAAELIAPGGTLICSDANEAMLDVARARAEKFGLDNIEFVRLELEWIDLETASVDVALCRWGVMLVVDPAAALTEIRRVLRPGGRATLAVWDLAERNPWATSPGRALVELGHAEPPDPNAPGMFALAAHGQLERMLADAGFLDVAVDAVAVDRRYGNVDEYVDETLDLSRPFSEVYEALGDSERAAFRDKLEALTEPFVAADGGLLLPGRTLVASASA